MTDIDSILQRIRSRLAKHGRKSKVASWTGIANSQLSEAMRLDWNPTADRIRIIEKALDKLFPGDNADPPQPQD